MMPVIKALFIPSGIGFMVGDFSKLKTVTTSYPEGNPKHLYDIIPVDMIVAIEEPGQMAMIRVFEVWQDGKLTWSYRGEYLVEYE